MPYDSGDAEHTALIGELEFRMDIVPATGQNPIIDRAQAYTELEKAGNALVGQVPASYLVREMTDYAATANAATGNAAIVQKSITDPITDAVSTIIPLPADFLRFISIKMKGWVNMPVDAIAQQEALYRNQLNPATRTDIFDPVVALVPYKTNADQALECFPQDNQANPISELYVVLEQDPEDINEQLRDALIWGGCVRMWKVLGEFDQAAAAQQEYDTLITRFNAGS